MKVCIFGLDVAGAITDEYIKGGAELQMALLAKTLASLGISVIIIDPKGLKDFGIGSNLRVERVSGWNIGMRGLRFFRYRLPELIWRLKSTEADVFYTRGFSAYDLIALVVARSIGARFVTAVAHDLELAGMRSRYSQWYKKSISLWNLFSTILPNEIGVWILRHFTDFIFVQHAYQADIARERYHTTVIQVNNIIDSETYNILPAGVRSNIIVVGEFAKRKDLDILAPIVEKLSDTIFEFVGAVADDVGDQIHKELSKYPNVIMHGALNRAATLRIIARGKALVNTSRAEGFPNTFLEAWELKTPVISLFVDPGGIIQKYRLGFWCHGDIERFSQLIQQEHYDLDTEYIRSYVRKHHSDQHIRQIFEKLLDTPRARKQ